MSDIGYHGNIRHPSIPRSRLVRSYGIEVPWFHVFKDVGRTQSHRNVFVRRLVGDYLQAVTNGEEHIWLQPKLESVEVVYR